MGDGLDKLQICDIHSSSMADMNPQDLLKRWLDRHGTIDKDRDMSESAQHPAEAEGYARFKRMAPQAELDLHGMRETEARDAIRSFLIQAAAAGLEKVSIIHGKGNHSREAQVLGRVVREELERSAYAGAFSFADGRHGGRGATWVRIRQPTIFRGK